MKKKLVLGALCVSIILTTGIGASAEVSESHSQWAEESLISADEAGLLPNFFADKTFAVFLAEPVADFLAVSVTATLFFFTFRREMAAFE